VEIERVIQKALKKKRECRYNSAQEMVRDLQVLRDRYQPGARRRSLQKLASSVVVSVVLAAGVVMVTQRFWHPALRLSVQSADPRRSVAVLGFQNLSGKKEDEWISTALAEMVSTELASGGQLRVVPGENIGRMKLDLALPVGVSFTSDTLQQIHRNLGVDVAVQGAYLRSPEHNLCIDVKIQDAEAGETIAAISEMGTDAQIANLVKQAGTRLRRQLGTSDIPLDAIDKNRAMLPGNPQAARFYSEGIAKLRVFDAMAARVSFMRAISIEPDHALTHSLLAESLSTLGYDTQARIEAHRAFELSHTLPRENQLLIEARYRELSYDYIAALDVYRSLWNFFPDNIEYGLRVFRSQQSAGLSKHCPATAAGS
jgi:TolB-like protein